MLREQNVWRRTARVAQVLIKWASKEIEEASWVDSKEMVKQFPGFSAREGQLIHLCGFTYKCIML